MSAINVLIQKSAVHLMTDGAAYLMDGTVKMIGPKVNLMPHLSCAVAFRGPATVRPIFGELIGHAAQSFGELKANIVQLLQAAAEAYAPLFEDCEAGPDFEVVVAGWSDDGPEAYMVASHDQHGDAWGMIPLTGLCITPSSTEIHAQMLAMLPEGCTEEDIDPATDGVGILEIQRRCLLDSNGISDTGRFAAVGGFAQLATVTRESVTTRVVHRWNDRVGLKLNRATRK